MTQKLPTIYGSQACVGRLVQIERTQPNATLRAYGPSLMEVDPKTINSVVLRRLIEEVKIEETTPRIYDRWHNRHNRSR